MTPKPDNRPDDPHEKRGKTDKARKRDKKVPSPAQADPLPASADPLAAEIDRLVAGEHPDPHHILGRHGSVIRARRPDAAAMRVLFPDGSASEMKQVHDGGVFEAEVMGSEDGYQLEAEYPGGQTVVFDDPYRFWPTVGELDVHLLGEGRHRRLWRVLGAQWRQHQGVAGVSFSVWAPTARAARVVGDFNLWDGRVHPMRSLGASGIWELFVPGVQPGTRYKYELLTREGQVHWAREAEVNSRRIGVEPGNPQFAVPRGAKLFQVDAEENLPEVIKTQDIARAVIK